MVDSELRVYDLAGHELASTPAVETSGDIDFDGSAVVFATQPYALAAVTTWDLAGPPPALPAGRCPGATLVRRRALADLKRRLLIVRVHCPATPALGCGGGWEARVRGRGAAIWTALRPDETATLHIPLDGTTACMLARHPVASGTIFLGAEYTLRPEAHARAAAFRLRITGGAGACRRR